MAAKTAGIDMEQIITSLSRYIYLYLVWRGAGCRADLTSVMTVITLICR